jgi:hypothetical protein
MISNEQIEYAVESAKLTADAWERPIGIYCTVEDPNWGVGGQLLVRRDPTRIGQPHFHLATVLPWGWPFARPEKE